MRSVDQWPLNWGNFREIYALLKVITNTFSKAGFFVVLDKVKHIARDKSSCLVLVGIN